MSKINVLSFEVANLIAAGEVVDRPSSVLKELLENAIDAGAKHITAEIRRGGVALIRVSDDGCGIEAEELPLAIQRHATSKIASAEDLDAIFTLGFRGEALSAIAAVSTLRIISKTAAMKDAAMIVAEGGRITEVSDVGAKDGTTVCVEHLFENVPARRKFLKKDATETAAASSTAERVAISHPEIAFTFIADGVTKFSTQGDGVLKNVLYVLYGRDFASKLLPIQGGDKRLSVQGFIGRSDNVRNSRNMQSMYINGRYVKSKTVMAALEQAFTSYIAPEKFPVCTLFLQIDPHFVDVNVHPAKLEVKFSDEKAVFDTVYYAVRSALTEGNYRPSWESATETKPQKTGLERLLRETLANQKGEQLRISPTVAPAPTPAAPTQRQADTGTPIRPHTAEPVYADVASSLAALHAYRDAKTKAENTGPRLSESAGAEPPAADAPIKEIPLSPDAWFSSLAPKIPSQGEGHSPKEREVSVSPPATDLSTEESAFSLTTADYRIVGEAFRCYVLVEYGETLLLIDKHAAHERILFEKLKAELAQGGVTAQGLMLPISLRLSHEEQAAVSEYAKEWEALGFSVQVKASGADILSVPSSMAPEHAEEVFCRILREITEHGGDPALVMDGIRERALYQIACKAAIKGGRAYEEAHIRWLVAQVMQMPDITVCPHGRPIAIELTKTQLDRKFDRLK